MVRRGGRTGASHGALCGLCMERAGQLDSQCPAPPVHVRYMSSEVEPCVVWALWVLLPFLAKLIVD
jgi:hypothetical protein